MQTKTKFDALYAIQQSIPSAEIMGELTKTTGRLIFKTDLTLKGDNIEEGVLNLDRDLSANELGEQAAKDLFKALNWMGQENEAVKGFVEVVAGEHRTLQQNMGHLVIALINHFAEAHEKGWHDARNEGICKLCAELKPLADKAYLPFI